ncbi:MAG: putative Zn finger-like uncharacterized protein, partial [Gammaproteobacteria bacterium]
MYTQCTQCETWFAITGDQLRQGHGAVRCGNCFASFDALVRLHDALPEGSIEGVRDAAFAASTSPLAEDSDDSSHTNSATEGTHPDGPPDASAEPEEGMLSDAAIRRDWSMSDIPNYPAERLHQTGQTDVSPEAGGWNDDARAVPTFGDVDDSAPDSEADRARWQANPYADLLAPGFQSAPDSGTRPNLPDNPSGEVSQPVGAEDAIASWHSPDGDTADDLKADESLPDTFDENKAFGASGPPPTPQHMADSGAESGSLMERALDHGDFDDETALDGALEHAPFDAEGEPISESPVTPDMAELGPIDHSRLDSLEHDPPPWIDDAALAGTSHGIGPAFASADPHDETAATADEHPGDGVVDAENPVQPIPDSADDTAGDLTRDSAGDCSGGPNGGAGGGSGAPVNTLGAAAGVGSALPHVLQADLARRERQRQNKRYRGLLVVGALALIAVLIAQYAWWMPADFVRRYPMSRAWVSTFCEHTGCTLPLLRAPSAIKIVSRDVRIHPKYEGALQVSAALLNTAGYSQPLPTIEFTIYNVNGQTIARRDFLPSDYLGPAGAAGKSMAPDRPV